MDGETIERTVREAIASVNDNAASVDRLSSELDEHARCAYRLVQWRPYSEVGHAASWLYLNGLSADNLSKSSSSSVRQWVAWLSAAVSRPHIRPGIGLG